MLLVLAACCSAPASAPPTAPAPDAARAAADAAIAVTTAATPVPPPPADRDGDGIPDDEDKCPDAAEDRDDFESGDGCPDPDNDRDGIADGDDKCPNEPGVAERQGCPRPIRGHRFGFAGRVQFSFKQSHCQKEDIPLLHAAAAAMNGNPQIERFSIEGHASGEGSDPRMMSLSRVRAQFVAEHLVGMGVARNRLVVRGFGDRKPVCREATPRCSRTNRRVDIGVEAALP